MKQTPFLKLLLPENTDTADQDNLNSNFAAIDSKLQELGENTGDISNAKAYSAAATARENLVSGETIATMVGKIMRWFADLKSAAFYSVANNDYTVDEGYVADARVAKTLRDDLNTLSNKLTSTSDDLKKSFQAGVDGIYNAIVAEGTTPAGKSLDQVKAGVKSLSSDRYSDGYSAVGVTASASGRTVTAKAGNGKTASANVAYAGDNGVVSVSTSSGTGIQTFDIVDGYATQIKVDRTSSYNSGYTNGKQMHTVKLGSGPNTYNISAYQNSPHVLYAVVTGISANCTWFNHDRRGYVSSASCSGSISIIDNGSTATFSVNNGWKQTTTDDDDGHARNDGISCSASIDCYIAYTG